MMPKTMVPTSGRREEVVVVALRGRNIDTVGAWLDLEIEGVEERGPARLAMRLSAWMCVPGPTLFALFGPRSCPGMAIGVYDIMSQPQNLWGGSGYVDGRFAVRILKF